MLLALCISRLSREASGGASQCAAGGGWVRSRSNRKDGNPHVSHAGKDGAIHHTARYLRRREWTQFPAPSRVNPRCYFASITDELAVCQPEKK